MNAGGRNSAVRNSTGHGSGSCAVGHRLVTDYFVAQGRHRDAGLRDVDVATLDPVLRSLLFTDGTVTRALEAVTLSRVTVDVVSQLPIALPTNVAQALKAESGRECVRRRIGMKIVGLRVGVWAESYMLPERLPAGFVDKLDGTPQGIGALMQRFKLESRRDLLCFGLGVAPDWGWLHRQACPTLVRSYRIVTNDQPMLQIVEAFAVARRDGVYNLAGQPERFHQKSTPPTTLSQHVQKPPAAATES